MFFIAGPTASGKTDVAVEVALRCNADIIGADAFQVYEGMEILTAKPSPEQLARVPHHLLGTVPRNTSYNVGTFVKEALSCALQVKNRGRLPMVVGGTGLYLRALMRGLAPVPPSAPELRGELETLPLEELQAKLHRLDPLTTVDLNNRRRVVRALEVCMVTGKPFSSFRQDWENADLAPCGVCLMPAREELHQRINVRTHLMFERGLLEEVRSLSDIGPTASQVLGLNECRAVLDGTLTRDKAIEQIQTATRQYAKRQITWFRKEPALRQIDPAQRSVEEVAAEICNHIAVFQQCT